ncbi:MAG: FecR family protein [Cyclobacteriaceae bacterium]|nr:FecR family protein [Cyclobacteriaceae bacterium]
MTRLKSRIQYLLRRYANSESSEDEEKELFSLLEQPNYESEIKTSLAELIEATDNFEIDPRRKGRIIEKVFGYTEPNLQSPPPKRRVFQLNQFAVAASVALLISFGSFLTWQWLDSHPHEEKTSLTTNDVPPGGNKAVLTLANGRQVILDSLLGTESFRQGSSVVTNQNGQLAYNIEKTPMDVVFNTLTTPRGGQYQVMLSDGSRAWLNAESSIYFPTNFTGNERRVRITGEVYFEIEKNPDMPFKVEVGQIEIRVLGTHFNINAYDSQDIVKTTLLEGSVEVIREKSALTLRPGQQAQVTSNGETNVIENVNIDEVMAWKAGFFQFNSADIETVMKQVARWYDVEVIYEGKVTTLFGGSIPRDMSASKVFKALELTGGVHFKIDGKTVIVTP